MQICRQTRQPRQHPTTQFSTGRMPFLPPNQQLQSTEGRIYLTQINTKLHCTCTGLSPIPVRSAVKSYLTSWCIQNSLSREYVGVRMWRFHAGVGGHRPLQIVTRPPNLAVLLSHCGQLLLRIISKFDAIRCQILRLKYTKFDFRWGSSPDPAGEAYNTPTDPLDVFKGPTSVSKLST